MNAFADILAEVATCAAPSRAPTARIAPVFDLGGCARKAEVAHAYASTRGGPDDARRSATTFDRQSFERALASALGDGRRLRALRRKIAWALHPDRTNREGAQLLAEANALIDAALREASAGMAASG